MGANSKIEWCHHSFNPWLGCSKVSEACRSCYAEAWAKRSGLVQWGDQAERRRTSESNWRQPLKWNREAEQAGERRRVFCASLADVFEDHPTIMPGWRADLGRLIQNTPYLDWLLLTKRPGNVVRMLPDFWINFSEPYGMPENVWLGTTVENQETADKRIPELLKIPARVRFLSCEPLLGPIQLGVSFVGGSFALYDYGVPDSRFHWVIAGGESGPNARPSHPYWFRSLRDQCQAAGVAFHFKQHGEWVAGSQVDQSLIANVPAGSIGGSKLCWMSPDGQLSKTGECHTTPGPDALMHKLGKVRAGRLLDGVEHNGFPEVA
jgi:protein gp37